MAVGARLRFEILRRDGHVCRYCGAKAPGVELTVDHVIPEALGGTDDPTNLVTACFPCNSGKSSIAPDSELVADINSDALRWARALAVAAERRHDELVLCDAVLDSFDTTWSAWRASGEELPRDPDWRQSVTAFLGLGLDELDLRRFVEDAMNAPVVPGEKVWKSFCRRSWDEVRIRQEYARAQLDAVG